MAVKVTDEERTLIERMLSTIGQRNRRNRIRRKYVEMESILPIPDNDIPPGYEQFKTAMSWPKKAVSAFAARQIPMGYSLPSPSSLLDDLEALIDEADYNLGERQVIESADELGCAFVFTTLGDSSAGEPPVIFTRRSAMTATAEEDPRTGRVRHALEHLDGQHVNLYLPGRIKQCQRDGGSWVVLDEATTGTSRVMCAPYDHDSTLYKPRGRSRVSRAVMDLTDEAARIALRQSVAGQLYMAPRPFIKGASMEDFQTPADRGGPASPFSVTTGDMWAMADVSVDDDPSMPDSLRRVDLQMIQQMSMQPFSEHYRRLAGDMSAATGMPPFYLGVMQDSNPTSAQAIEASEIDFVRQIRAQEPILGRGRKTLALNALSLLEGMDVDAARFPELRGLHADWEDPRTRSMSEQSQMAALQVQAGNIQPGTKNTLSMLPVSPQFIERAEQENQRAAGGSVLDRIMGEGQRGESLKERADALNALIRSGVSPESAARIAGIEGAEFRDDLIPNTMRSEAT